MVWEFLHLRIVFVEPCLDRIIIPSLPGGGGRHLRFAFSLTGPTPTFSKISKTTSRCVPKLQGPPILQG